MKHSNAFRFVLLILLLIPAHSLSGNGDKTSFTKPEKQLRSLVVSITEKAAEYWLDNCRKETVTMLSTAGVLFDKPGSFPGLNTLPLPSTKKPASLK